MLKIAILFLLHIIRANSRGEEPDVRIRKNLTRTSEFFSETVTKNDEIYNHGPTFERHCETNTNEHAKRSRTVTNTYNTNT